MSFYNHTDKKSGDGLAITQWNDLSSAVAGNSGLKLAIADEDKIAIGMENTNAKLGVNGDTDMRGSLSVSGAVTIGTSSQAATLKVDAGGGDNVGLAVTGRIRSTGSKGGMWVDDGNLFMGKSDDNIGFWNKGWHLKVAANGNIGMGVDPSASHKLEVNGAVKATKFIGDGSGLTNLSVGLNGLNLATEGGNVGIGTPSPDVKLEVDAGGGDTLGLLVNGRIRSTGGKGGMWVGDKLFVGKTGNNIGFWNEGWHFKVAANGNIGIGKDPTSNKLEVNGTVKATNIKIGSTVISENDLKVLKKLASDKLVVKIKSNVNNAVLDHFRGNVNRGDGERTVQFQNNSSGWSKHHTMTLLVKP